MGKPMGIKWRNGRAYFRRRVPTDLIPVLGKKEIVKALNTADKAKAKVLKALEDANAEKLFLELREKQQLAKDNPDQLSSLSEEQLAGLAMRWRDETERKNFLLKAKSTTPLTEQEWQDMYISLEFELQDIRDAIRLQDTGPGMTTGGDFLDRLGITYDSKSESFRRFGFYMNQSIVDFTQNALREAKGLKIAVTHPGYAFGSSTVPEKTITFEKLFDLYLSDPSRQRNAKTYENYKFTLSILKDVLGPNKRVHTLTREECLNLMAFLKTLPKNASTKFPGKSLVEATEAGKKTNAPVLSAKSVTKYMEQLSSVLKFAQRFQYIHHNVAEGLRMERPTDGSDQRNPFTIEDLKKMFNAPLYTGCMDDEYGFHKPGPNVPRRARFWCPLISLFTGMRLNEICQLEVDDIQPENGVEVILVRYEGKAGPKKLKTRQSKRKIPIHPELEKLGFLRHVEDMRKKGHISIFPELKAGTELRYKSDMLSPKLNRFVASVGLKGGMERKDFHSFRHTFTTAMRNAGIPDDAKDEIGGWSKRGTRASIYEAPYQPEQLYKFICTVEYAGLDLSHLYA